MTETRKLFKLGRAKNIPRGAPGRLSTAYGALASAAEHYQKAIHAVPFEKYNCRNPELL